MARFLLVFVLLACTSSFLQGQNRSRQYMDRITRDLKISETAPAELLSSRSLVLFESSFKQDELNRIQSAFQQIGIDADFYLEVEKVLAGMDTERAYSTYFNTREIKFILLLLRAPTEGYTLIATPYDGTSKLVAPAQIAWKVNDRSLEELMNKVYRDSWLREKKQNFLINDIPEMDIVVPFISGRRAELFPIDLRIDQLAVPKAPDAALQAEVDTLFKNFYPYPEKFKMIASVPADEKELTKQGFQYLLVYVNCSGKLGHDILGYSMATAASAYGSMSYPNGSAQLKTISAEQPVYKFYIKHIRSGNVFLGTKWDADESYSQALKNHVKGFRAELKLD